MKIALTVLALALALPTIGSSMAWEGGRYQAVQLADGIVLIIDTRTGEVVKRCLFDHCEKVSF